MCVKLSLGKFTVPEAAASNGQKFKTVKTFV